MSAWSTRMRDAAPAAISLLGVLPIDVYRMIFCALDYATLRDACRMLNSVLGPIACQTLVTLRYTLNTNHATTIERSIDAPAILSPYDAGRIVGACALPLGGFLLLLRVTGWCPAVAALVLASFDAQAKLQRILPLRVSPVPHVPQPLADYDVRYMHAHGRCVYMLLVHRETQLMLCYTLDADEPPCVHILAHALASDVPREGPARWIEHSIQTCAVANVEPLRFVLCCRGRRGADALDQVVMLELDGAVRIRRALTLSTPTELNLARYETTAPWPRSGHYAGLDPLFHVDTHGRYLFLSPQVDTCAALLLFEPQHGVLLACVSLGWHSFNLAFTSVPTAEPHSSLYVHNYRDGCAVLISLRQVATPPTLCPVPYVAITHSSIRLDDGYVLVGASLDKDRLVLCKQPIHYVS